MKHAFRVIDIAAGLAVFALLTGCSGPPLSTDLERGTIDTSNLDMIEVQDLLNDRASTQVYKVFINSNIVAETKNAPANILVQNDESNRLDCKVVITINNTDRVIYESDIIPAGYKIEYARLQEELEVGTYPCTASVKLLNQDGSVKSALDLSTQVTILT